MKSFEKLLQQNQQWSLAKKTENPDFFNKLSKSQTPEYLWIGCSDSRVPAEVIVKAEPGEIFNHRNIANQVIHTDFNCLSVLQYAVNVLEIKHIIVCGHYNCGGIRAALQKQSPNLVVANKWLMHIKNTYRLHQQELDSIENSIARENRLVELNVLEQVYSLAHTSVVQSAWASDNSPSLHGWVYGLEDGLLNTLLTLHPQQHLIHPIFQYESSSHKHLEPLRSNQVMDCAASVD